MKLKYLFIPIMLGPLFLMGQSIYEAGLTIGGVTYYESGFTLNGKNLSVEQGGNLYLTYAYVKTTKTGSQDVCAARINYCVYPASGSCSGGFFVHNLPFSNDISCGSPCTQQWDSDGNSLNVNLANGLVAGSYKIAVYYDATADDQGGCPSPFIAYFSNGGANYVANLTVTAPAAVGLSTFEALRKDREVELSWTTEVERNHSHFEIERSADMHQWGTIGIVEGRGDSDLRGKYDFVDDKPAAGTAYYRLRMVDVNDRFEFSPVVKVESGKTRQWQISPNPASDRFSIDLKGDETPEQIRVRIYNAAGNLVLESIRENASRTSVSVDQLPQGIYSVEIMGDEQTIERHLVFIR